MVWTPPPGRPSPWRCEARQRASWLKTVQVVAQPFRDHQDMSTWLLAQELEPNPEPWTILNLLASAEPGALSLQIPQICRRLAHWRQSRGASLPHSASWRRSNIWRRGNGSSARGLG